MIVDALGTRIHVEVTGEGKPIVFIHGLGSTGNVWYAQRSVLSKNFKVVTLDLPGSGQSGKQEEKYSMERWVNQLQKVADELKLEKFVLVGHSMGTILVQKYAARFRERLLGLVVCGGLTEVPAGGKEAFLKRAELVQRDGMEAVADTVLAGALTPATREANPVLAGLCRALLLGNDPASYARQCHALIDGSAKDDQPKVACPTLVLVGDQDSVTPLSMSQAIASKISGAQLRIVPATAHLTMAERPENFNMLLLEFLARL